MNIDDENADRAERALRAAFERHAEATPPVGVDATAVRRASKRRGRRVVMGLAGAVVFVGAAVAVAWVPDAPDERTATGPTGPTPGEPSAGDGGVEPPDGWRFENYRDVQLEVPADWGYGPGSVSDWCVDDGRWLPKEPYVGRVDNEAVRSIGCPGGVPPALQVAHVSFAPITPGGEPDETHGPVGDAGLMSIRQRVGHARVTVVAPPPLAQHILSSARVVDESPSGCPVSHPIQGPSFARPSGGDTPLSELRRVDSISVCRYAISAEPDRRVPGLITSYELTGPAAAARLASLKAAPVGGGPDTPEHCVHDLIGDEAIVVRLMSGGEANELYVYYNWCFGNGIDDGTTKRQLTRDTCQPLLDGMHIVRWTGSGATSEVCHGVRPTK